MQNFPKACFTVALLISLVLAGCVSAPKSDTTLLLAQDYRAMTDAELIGYEQRLNDEIAGAGRSDSGGVSVGVGFGFFGGGTGLGVGADRQVRQSDKLAALRARRDEIRAEMRRRGLLESPPVE